MAFSGKGLGTEGSPYEIRTIVQLQEISDDVTAHYIVANNIDAAVTSTWNGGEGFIPIVSFAGSLNGHGHTIDGLIINRPSSSFQAIFSELGAGAAIRNIGLTDIDITGKAYIGSLISYIPSSCVIENCYSTGAIESVGTYQYGIFTAGLVAYVDSSSAYITNCFSGCSVTTAPSRGYNGGLVGYLKSGTVTNCFSYGLISIDGGNGGIVGQVDSGVVIDSYYDTTTSGMSDTGKGDLRTTAQLQNILCFTDEDYPTTGAGPTTPWDIEEVAAVADELWSIVDESGYPFLTLYQWVKARDVGAWVWGKVKAYVSGAWGYKFIKYYNGSSWV